MFREGRGISKNKQGKKYYRSFDFKPKKNALTPGCKGFMITCNAQEQRALVEAYNVLDEFYDKLYGTQKENETEACDSVAEKSIEDELEGELQSMRNSGSSRYRFKQKSTGVRNVIFVNAETGDPCEIALALLGHIKETKIPVSRFLLRLIPVLSVCKAFLDSLKEVTSETLDDFLIKRPQYNDETRNVTYAVQYHARNNTKAFAKEEVFAVVNDVVSTKNYPWKINLDNPDLTVNIDLLGTMCCIGVLPDYAAFKKYNLTELAVQPVKEGDASSPEKKSCAENNEAASSSNEKELENMCSSAIEES